jgi:antitoxin component YwqK of YwqJK toxin-antitoxin module
MGIRHGPWRVFSAAGKIEQAETWVEGQRHGSWVQMDQAGAPLNRFSWEEGTLLTVEAQPEQ